MKQKKIIALLLCVCMMLSLLPTSAAATETVEESGAQTTDVAFETLDGVDADLKADGKDTQKVESLGYDADEIVTVVVVMEEKSLLDQGYTKRQIANGDADLTVAKKALLSKQDDLLAKIEVATEGKMEAGWRYSVVISGFSVDVPYGSLAEIEAMEGVRYAFVAPVYSVPEDATVTTDMISTTTSFGSAEAWQTLGYTGAGMRIAVLDTGLDWDHPSFVDDPKLAESSLYTSELADILPELNASTVYSEANGTELTVDDVYYGAKVPFGFNYASASLDITHDNDEAGYHGTHVAGIAAANAIDSTDVVGVAPDAQLIVMKVFQPEGGASFADLVAAIEDCYRLNVDAINMSLGYDAGFSTIGYDLWDEIFDKLSANDVIAAVSAGNAYSAALENGYGTDTNLTIDPDNGIVSAPASWQGTTMVASIENSTTMMNYFAVGENNITYRDAQQTFAFTDIAGTYEYVMVPGTGSEEDFASVNAEGRVAVVQRGELSFTDKQTNAYNAGAVACIVYDNTDDDLIYMQDAGLLPNVFISKANGEIMAAHATDGVGTIVIKGTDEMLPASNPDGGKMSSFSSWGTTPDLKLEPDVTAPGGNIYSTITDGEYGILSGTSMSAPHIAGMAALVLQYLHEEHSDLTDAQMHTVAEALIMSTATPVMESDEAEYSPRKQGAGLANVCDAIVSSGYLTVNGSTPKVSMGDDDARTGAYSFSFEIHNFSDRTASYELDASLLTDLVDTTYAENGYLFMGETSKALSSEATFYVQEGNIVDVYDANGDGACNFDDVQYLLDGIVGLTEIPKETAAAFDLDGNGTLGTPDAQLLFEAIESGLTESDIVVLQPGQTVTVSVSIQLNEDDMAYMEEYYPYGIYVEGFVRCYALDEDDADLSLPFMGFYGDWSEARVFDGGWYTDEEVEYNRYPNVAYVNYGQYSYYFGMNSYLTDEAYDPSHNVISPNDDLYADTLEDIYLSLMRSAKSLRFVYTDDATGDVLYEETAEWVSKTYYVSGYDVCYPFVYSDYFDTTYDFTDADGNYLPNNTSVTLTIEACLDDGDDIVDETITIPITVDTEAPELLGAKKTVDGEKTTLELTFRDNVATAVAALVAVDGNNIYEMCGVEDPEKGDDGYRTYTLTLDVTGLTKVELVLADYGLNEAYYGLNLAGEGESLGDLIAYQYNLDYYTNSWVAFDTDVNCDETPLFTGTANFVCAEYVNGFVFAQTESGALYGFPYEALLSDSLSLEMTYITQLDNVYQDLAYSYAEGKLYGLYTSEYDGFPTSEIYSINLNGEYYDSSQWTTVAAYGESWVAQRGALYGLSMAVGCDGTVYVLGLNYDWDLEQLTETAHLWSAGMEYNEWYGSYQLGAFAEIADTGIGMNYLQSMTWDHNSETLYWAQFHVVGMDPVSELYEVNPETAECTKVGTLSGETSALIAPLTDETAAKEEHLNLPTMDTEEIATPSFSEETINMNLGGTRQMACSFDPWYSNHKDLVWSSSDPSIVSVDENGLLTANGEGTAVITAANAEDETKFDTCTVVVAVLSLKYEGLFTTQTAGTGSTGGVQMYTFEMNEGVSEFNVGNPITASEELNYGLDIATSTYARGSIWACEYNNSGMIYEIDPESGEVLSYLEPVDGDPLFGLAYSEKLDNFTAIMDMYLYVDQPFTADVYQDMLDSYDEETHERWWHKLDMLPYLIESNTGFVTQEMTIGASSDIVFCGVTILDNETYYESNGDYMGNGYDYNMYTSTQTIVLMDNVGRLWYVDEITDMYYYADDYGNTYYLDQNFAETGSYESMISATTNGVEAIDNGDGTYNVFIIREIVETPLTDMFRQGRMPEITYIFSDITYAGKTEDGANMYAISMYDYWNNGTTTEMYLYVEGVGTGEFELDYNTWSYVEIKTPDQLYSLGSIGAHNIAATINGAEVIGGVSSGSGEEATESNAMAVSAYRGTK